MSRFLKRIVPFFVMVSFALAGCGEISSSDSPAVPLPGGDDNVIQIPTDVVQGTTRVQAVQGSLVDLGDLVGSLDNTWWYTRVAAINNSGVIVGQSNQGSVVKGAFLWNPATQANQFIGIHSGAYDGGNKNFIYSEAVGINSGGLIIGNSTTGTGWPNETEKRAFLFNMANNQFRDIHLQRYVDFNGDIVENARNFSEAIAINNHGEVVITAESPDGKHAYYWDGQTSADGFPLYFRLGRIIGEDGEAVAINENFQTVINSGGTAVFHDLFDNAIEVLNHLPNASEAKAVAINDSGNVVGVSGSLGFFWRGGAMYPIGHLGGGTSEAVAINSNNQVAGNSTVPGGASRAIVWSIVNGRGQIMNLGTLGGANSYATGINEAGQVVGYSETGRTYTEGSISVNEVRGFLWSNGVMYDLGVHDEFYNYPFVKPFPFSEAVAINNNGEIAGNSHSINSHFRGFYLQPTLP